MIQFRGFLRVFSVVFFALVLAGSLPAQSEDPSGPPPRGHHGPPPRPSAEGDVKFLTKLLSLSAEQQAQVKTILTERNRKVEKLLRSLHDKQKKGSQSQQADENNRPQPSDTTPPPPPPEESEHALKQLAPDDLYEIKDALLTIYGEANGKIAPLLTEKQTRKFQRWVNKQKKYLEHGALPPREDENDLLGNPAPGGNNAEDVSNPTY